MTIGKITSNQINPTVSTNTTTVTDNSKNLQNQITTKQQSLNRLTSDSKLSAQEKEKKRREIQREIDELNRKLELARLKQEDAEKKAAAQKEKADAQKADAQKADLLAQSNSKVDTSSNTSSKKVTNDTIKEASADKQPVDATKTQEEEKPKHIDMPIEDVQKMLTADYELQKELAQKSVDKQIDTTVSKINSEIKQDTLRGVDTASKEAEIETIRAKENFWTTEAQNPTDKPAEPETHAITGMNLQAKIAIDTI